jgi:peroxiredoxin
LARIYDDILAAGADLWAISPQDGEHNQALREKRELPFPILADEDQAVIETWGIFNYRDPKGRPIPYPATYVLEKDGRIAWRYLGLIARQRPTPGAILAAVTDLGGEQPADA